MDQEVFDSLCENQDGKCAICGVSGEESIYKSLYVDHCHGTGNIRGLLCFNCNVAIGHFRDDINRLTSAISYLESHND